MRKVSVFRLLVIAATFVIMLYSVFYIKDYVIAIAAVITLALIILLWRFEIKYMKIFLDFIKTSWSGSTSTETKKAAIELIGNDNVEFIESTSQQFVETVRSLFLKYTSVLKSIGKWLDETVEEVARIRHSTEEFKTKGQEALGVSRTILQSLDNIRNTIKEYLEGAHELYDKIMERQGHSEEILSNLELITNEFEKLATNLVNVFNELFNYWGTLETSINEISNVTNEISRISKRTSILALNASMEATRAGDIGKGFAVVAENIQKLAADTKVNAERISKNIRELLEKANALREAMSTGSKEITKFKENVNKIISYISGSVKDLTSVFSETISELSHIESMSDVLGVIETNVSEISGILNEINEILDKSVQLITQLENMLIEKSTELREIIEKINRNMMKVEETINRYRDAVITTSDIDQELRKLYEELRGLVTLVYVAIDGVGVRTHPYIETGEGFDYTSRPWYKRTRERMEPVWIDPYLDYNIGDYVVTYSTPLVKDGRFFGVLCADVKLRSLL